MAKVLLGLPDATTAAAYNLVPAYSDISSDEKIAALFPEGTVTKWEAARYYLNEVVAAGGYTLVDNFADLFVPGNKHNRESIWEVEYMGGQVEECGSPYYTSFAPANYAPRASANPNGYIPTALANKGGGDCTPTGYFMTMTKKWDSMWPDYTMPALFDGQVYSDRRISNGVRNDVEIPALPVNENLDYPQSAEFPYDSYTGTTWRTTILGFGDDNQYFCGKYQSASAFKAKDSDDNWYILRYADVLLMLAEAEAGCNAGLLTQGVLDNTINLVRGRAGVIPYTVTGNSADAWVLDTPARVADAIFEERALELSFEGHRWFDLVRSGKAVEVMNSHFEKFYNAYTSNSAPNTDKYFMKNQKVTIDQYCTLFPIPVTELLVNPKLTPNERAR
jgi:hypothetical protein